MVRFSVFPLLVVAALAANPRRPLPSRPRSSDGVASARARVRRPAPEADRPFVHAIVTRGGAPPMVVVRA